MMSDTVIIAAITSIGLVLSSSITAAAVIYGAKGVKKSMDGAVTVLIEANKEIVQGKDDMIKVKDEHIEEQKELNKK